MNRKAQRRDGGAACSLCLSPAAASCLLWTPRLGDDHSALIAWIVINKWRIGERRGLQVREGTGRGRGRRAWGQGAGGSKPRVKKESEGPERGEWEAVTRRRRPRAAKIAPAPDMIAGQK